MSSGPDLYLVCKSCGAEVSPYITECPYCGTRIQKRAPKLDRGGVPKAPSVRARARSCRGCARARSRASAPTGARGPSGCSCSCRWSSRSASSRGSIPLTDFTLRRRRSTSPGARSPRRSPTPPTGYEAITVGRDRAVRLAARDAATAGGRRCSSSWSTGVGGAYVAVEVAGEGIVARAPTAPRWACSPRGRCATCSAAAAAARTTATCWACSRSPPCSCCCRWRRPRLRDRRDRRRRRGPPARARVRAMPSAEPPPALGRLTRRLPRVARVDVEPRQPRRDATSRFRHADRAGRPATRRPTTQPSISRRARGDRGEQAARGHRVAHQPRARRPGDGAPGREVVRVARGCACEPPASARSSASSSSTPSIAGTAAASISAARPEAAPARACGRAGRSR